ncbi:hypothetical protein [Lactobacillus apis]|uniref:hypothetical protein n=1 Tax=Lactobacillus apis TaxID=303541 RepID=UPI00164FBF93|nr:hypothetical protein [Lactobacillus apis]MBC6361017.1 hypothetical protein [Lactobacillus apis]
MNLPKSKYVTLISFCDLVLNISTGLGIIILAMNPADTSKTFTYGIILGLLFTAAVTKHNLEKRVIKPKILKNIYQHVLIKLLPAFFTICLSVYMISYGIGPILIHKIKPDAVTNIKSLNKIIEKVKLDGFHTFILLVGVAMLTVLLFLLVFNTIEHFPKANIDYVFTALTTITVITALISSMGMFFSAIAWVIIMILAIAIVSIKL